MAMPYTEALLRSTPRIANPSHTRLLTIEGRPPDLSSPPPGCPFAPRCPYAQDKCRESEPPLRTVGSQDHLFACWFPLVDGISTAPSVPVNLQASNGTGSPGSTSTDQDLSSGAATTGAATDGESGR
jgi:oligopeptide/dipeptide ABC transporter ATP-binding protein